MIEEDRKLGESDIKALIKLKVWKKRFSYLTFNGLMVLFVGIVCSVLGIAFGTTPFWAFSFILKLLAGPLLILGAVLTFSGTILGLLISYKDKLRILSSKEGEEVIVDSLISRCENKNYANYDEYATVISILGDIGNKRATQFILVALKDKNANVRKKSAEALGKIGGTAVEPLEKIGEPTVESLIQALKDENYDVRFEAAEALGKIRDERAVEPLIQALKVEGESCGLVKKAAEALGKIGEPAVESLIQALKDDDSAVRYLAASALGEIKDERAVEVLIPALKDDGSIIGNRISYVRVKAAEALGKIGEPAVELLMQALKDDDNNVRYLAAWALGEIKDERAVEPLNQLLNDIDANIRETAKEAMKKIRKSS